MLPRLIVGLGNPGPKYEQTRHNVGFTVVDAALAGFGSRVVERPAYASMLYAVRFAGLQRWFMKPLTFMNETGTAVDKAARAMQLLPNEIMLLYDCMDLPVGRIRLRERGSSGGHRGVESVIQALGTEDVPRLRVGIGRPGEAAIDHVLSAWHADELPAVAEIIAAAAAAVLAALRHGVQHAMNQYNSWTLNGAPGPTVQE